MNERLGGLEKPIVVAVDTAIAVYGGAYALDMAINILQTLSNLGQVAGDAAGVVLGLIVLIGGAKTAIKDSRSAKK